MVKEVKKDAKQDSARWDAEIEKVLCDLLVDQVNLGNRPNSFIKSSWVLVREEFNKINQTNFTMEQIKNRYNLLRYRYRDFTKILSVTGLGWNASDKTVEEIVEGSWETHEKAYPDHKKYKSTGCPLYDELGVIFGDVHASGSFSKSSAQEKSHHVKVEPDVESFDIDPVIPISKDVDEEGQSCTKDVSNQRKKMPSSPSEPPPKKQSKGSELAQALFAIADATKSKNVKTSPEDDPYPYQFVSGS